MRRSLILLPLIAGFLALAGCATRAPEGVAVVQPFTVDRYLGTWFEIARLDHRFERGMSEVSATYTKAEDGSLTVRNQGWTGTTWKSANGRAVFLGEPGIPSLAVTFFWPFTGGYHVIALDQDGYRWAMVCGPDRDYLWILARDPALDPMVYNQLIAQAKAAGFPIEGLIRVAHGQPGIPPRP